MLKEAGSYNCFIVTAIQPDVKTTIHYKGNSVEHICVHSGKQKEGNSMSGNGGTVPCSSEQKPGHSGVRSHLKSMRCFGNPAL